MLIQITQNENILQLEVQLKKFLTSALDREK
jgi:hypothetical protein